MRMLAEIRFDSAVAGHIMDQLETDRNEIIFLWDHAKGTPRGGSLAVPCVVYMDDLSEEENGWYCGTYTIELTDDAMIHDHWCGDWCPADLSVFRPVKNEEVD